MTREEARAAGLATYQTGKPCRRDHPDCERSTATGRCLECRRADCRAAYAADPERTIARTKAYAKAHADERNQMARSRVGEAREKQRAACRLWNAENAEKKAAIDRAWTETHRKHVRAYQRAWKARRRAAHHQEAAVALPPAPAPPAPP